MSDTLFKWFTDNLLKANPEKPHLLTNSAQEIQINIGAMAISNSKCKKLLAIHINKKLTNEPYVRSLWKKASQKLNASARIASSFHNRKLNNHINRIHERALRIVYQTIIQRLTNFLQKTVPSEFMTVICRNDLLKHLKLK